MELDYIAARVEEARLAEEEAKLNREAGSANVVVDKAAAEAEEAELARWAGAAGEASGADTGSPLVEDVADGSSEEEGEEERTATTDPPITEKRRVMRRATSGEPVRLDRAAQLRQAQEAPVC